MLALDVQLQRGNFDLQASLDLEAPVTGLFGSSGSGKSTLLNIVAGLAKPDQGWLKLGEQSLFDSRKRINVSPNKREIGVVFQDSQLFPHMPIQQNLMYGYKRTDKKHRRFIDKEIIDLLEIGHVLKKRPHQLSGGEKQRVGIGRALLASPRFLLLDEPLASLDKGLKQQILPFLKRVKDELQIPMVYISHSMEEILHLTEHLVIINQGRILGSGHFYDVIKDEGVQGVASNLGLENIMRVKIAEHDEIHGQTEACCDGMSLHLPLEKKYQRGEECYVSVRSNEIALSTQYIDFISIQNQMKGRVIDIEQHVSRITVIVDIGQLIAVDISPKAFAQLNFTVGSEVYCLIKSQAFAYLGGTQ